MVSGHFHGGVDVDWKCCLVRSCVRSRRDLPARAWSSWRSGSILVIDDGLAEKGVFYAADICLGLRSASGMMLSEPHPNGVLIEQINKTGRAMLTADSG